MRLANVDKGVGGRHLFILKSQDYFARNKFM
jgi:hypothetical protein